MTVGLTHHYQTVKNIISNKLNGEITEQTALDITLSGKVFRYPLSKPEDLINKDAFCIKFNLKQGKGEVCVAINDEATLDLEMKVKNLPISFHEIFTSRSSMKEEITIQDGDITYTTTNFTIPRRHITEKLTFIARDIGDVVDIKLYMHTTPVRVEEMLEKIAQYIKE